MNIKNFNIFEQHVEKIALALAVAGAGWMIWMSLDPPKIPDANGNMIEVSQVEGKVDAAVNQLEAARKATLARGALKTEIPSYIDAYDKSVRTPLDQRLVAAAVPSFVPHQAPVVQMNLTPSKVGNGLVITPTVPAPLDLSAVPWRGTVHEPNVPLQVAGAAAPPAPGPSGPAGAAAAAAAPKDSRDQDLVVVQGSLPLAQFTNSMKDENIPIEKRLTGDAQKTVVYKIEAQRREKISGGAWTPWVDVPAASSPPAPGNVPPVTVDQVAAAAANIDPLLASLQQSQKQITQPDSYATPEGKPVLRLLVKGDAAQLVPDPLMPNAPPAPPPPPPTAPPTTAPAALPTTPFWIVDDHVIPGKEYQYQVRLDMFNPTFNWTINGQPGKLEDPAMRDKPVIQSAWALVPNAVEVPNDMYFFINGPVGGGAAGQQAISAQVFKWTNGHWRVDRNAPAQPGTPIIGNVVVPLPVRTLTVPTGHTVVDVYPVPGGNGSEVQVVLLTPTGDLITRDSLSDSVRNNQRHHDIDEEMKKDLPPVTPPKPPVPGGSTPGTPGVPRPGGRPPAPPAAGGTGAPTITPGGPM